MKCKHTKRLLTAVRRHLSKLRSKRRNAYLLHTQHHQKKTLRISWSIGATICSYLKCIVYDKLLKPRQSFLITLYKMTTVLSQRGNISEAVCSLEPYAGFG